jgi:NDP-sugar pyrophosphorylase family protein
MQAMILAAGTGSRLKPLTNNTPKALIPLAGKPMIDYLVEKFIAAGVADIIINVHHLSDQIIRYFEKKPNFDVRITFSEESILLDTGGGLKKAGWFFEKDEPFILHNVDVYSTIDFNKMVDYHVKKNNLATLAVRKRKTSRYLLFNSQQHLVGWQSLKENRIRWARKSEVNPESFSFLGIHVISPDIFSLLPEEDTFSIIDAYLQLAEQGYNIGAYPNEDDFWFDLGSFENIKAAEKQVADTG